MHFAQVRNYVFFRSGNTDVATDIAQETFLRIWEKQENVQAEKVKGLLFKVASDLFVTYYRKEKRSFNFFKHYKIEETAASPEELMAFEQLKGSYEKALLEMPEKQRTVFLYRQVENCKNA